MIQHGDLVKSTFYGVSETFIVYAVCCSILTRHTIVMVNENIGYQIELCEKL